eukprot:NODE_1038_length_2501_cov_0.332223.p1 type:complete len:450 gc:universal NODE_1038_length_2501_cov_0.332223:1113-2462(+)
MTFHSDSEDDQPKLLRVDSRMNRRASMKSNLSHMTKEEFIWEDKDEELQHSRLTKWIPVISVVILPIFLVPYFVGIGMGDLSTFDNSKNPKIESSDSSVGDLNSNGIVVSQELMRWGIWLTSIYSIFVVSWVSLHFLPFIFYKLYILVTKRKSERFKDLFEYLRALRRYIIWLCIAICSNIVYEVLWNTLNRGGDDRAAPNYIVIISYLLRIFVFYSIFRLGEKLLMMVLFIHLKHKTFKDRIEASKVALKTIEHLEVQLDRSHDWKENKNRLLNEGSKLFSWIKSGQVNEMDITSDINAKRLAKKLFTSLSKDKQIIRPDDFYPYFSDVETSMDAFYLFDRDRNGDISKSEMKTAITSIYQERRFILSSFKDINDVVKKLDRILFTIVCIITIVYGFTVFGNNVLAAAVPLLSGSLALSFMFAETAKEFFNSLLFLFGTHPFDSGTNY